MAVTEAQIAIPNLESNHLVFDRCMYSTKNEAVTATSFIVETLLYIKTRQAM
jgi:hypothetical protein